MKISINSFHKAFESRIRLGIMSALENLIKESARKDIVFTK